MVWVLGSDAGNTRYMPYRHRIYNARLKIKAEYFNMEESFYLFPKENIRFKEKIEYSQIK
jgi:hypothetical protein